MEWYNVRTKVPERGKKVMIISEEGKILSNYLYDSEYYTDEELKSEIWESFIVKNYDYWCYINDLIDYARIKAN